MNAFFDDFFVRYRDHLALDAQGELRRKADIKSTRSQDAVIASLPEALAAQVPNAGTPDERHLSFATWVLSLPMTTRRDIGLPIPKPPRGIHFVPGQTNLFYDFKNTDAVLEAFEEIGIRLHGSLLDFGCSSGRNIATLERCFNGALDLHGVDPARSSIDWAASQLPNATFKVNGQEPPLDYDDDLFDFVIAKSIWTHFSARAAKAWFQEIARVLKPGGHFLFSTHGPHDIAYRLKYDIPSPSYHHFAGDPHWTKERFLKDVIDGLDRDGFYFQSFKEIRGQSDLAKIEEADTADWGVTFMLPDYLRDRLLPPELDIVARNIGQTGNRHDVYIVRKR